RLLLLDEPTAYLDLKHALQIYGILRRLNRERGLTVIAVSHDLNLAARHTSRLALLHRGHLVADGPPASVLTAELIRRAYGAGPASSAARPGATRACVRSPALRASPVAPVLADPSALALLDAPLGSSRRTAG